MKIIRKKPLKKKESDLDDIEAEWDEFGENIGQLVHRTVGSFPARNPRMRTCAFSFGRRSYFLPLVLFVIAVIWLLSKLNYIPADLLFPIILLTIAVLWFLRKFFLFR